MTDHWGRRSTQSVYTHASVELTVSKLVSTRTMALPLADVENSPCLWTDKSDARSTAACRCIIAMGPPRTDIRRRGFRRHALEGSEEIGLHP